MRTRSSVSELDGGGTLPVRLQGSDPTKILHLFCPRTLRYLALPGAGELCLHPTHTRAFSKLSGDEVGIVFSGLCNPLEPRVSVDFGSVSRGLRVLIQAVRQQLRPGHEVAIKLCLKLEMMNCEQLREARTVDWNYDDCHDLSVTDMATLGTLGLVLAALEELHLTDIVAVLGVQRLADGLGADALPAVTTVTLVHVHVGDAGASALTAALGRGALPTLKILSLGRWRWGRWRRRRWAGAGNVSTER